MSELRIGDKVYQLTDDGYCAHCEAYCASWLSDCSNPIHTMPVEEIEKHIVKPPR